jgi:hypothetical protein
MAASYPQQTGAPQGAHGHGAPAGGGLPPELEVRRAALEALGFRVVFADSVSVIATRARWYWDAFFTKLTTVVWVKRVRTLTAHDMEVDRQWLAANASNLDPSTLPVGFQKGRSSVVVYLADQASDDARARAASSPPIEFGSVSLAGILEGAGHRHCFMGTPMWGAVFYGKLKFLVQKMIAPAEGPPKEPVSLLGAGMVIFLLGTMALAFCGVPLMMALSR